jgi:hypothetical protein
VAATRLNEDHIDLIRYLEVQLMDMSANFTRWYEPEVTDDDVPPFST